MSKGTRPSLSVFLLPLVCGIGVIGVMVFSGKFLTEKYDEYNVSLEKEKEKLAQLQEIDDQIQTLRQKQIRFQNDRGFVARVAHEQGMVFSNEIRVDFEER